jgi:hypothetical protein
MNIFAVLVEDHVLSLYLKEKVNIIHQRERERERERERKERYFGDYGCTAHEQTSSS